MTSSPAFSHEGRGEDVSRAAGIDADPERAGVLTRIFQQVASVSQLRALGTAMAAGSMFTNAMSSYSAGIRRRRNRVLRGQKSGREQAERVAIRRRVGNLLRPEHAACARPVDDDDLLSQLSFQELDEGPCRQIGAAARRERHDQADGFRRIGLRLRRRGGAAMPSRAQAHTGPARSPTTAPASTFVARTVISAAQHGQQQHDHQNRSLAFPRPAVSRK